MNSSGIPPKQEREAFEYEGNGIATLNESIVEKEVETNHEKLKGNNSTEIDAVRSQEHEANSITETNVNLDEDTLENRTEIYQKEGKTDSDKMVSSIMREEDISTNISDEMANKEDKSEPTDDKKDRRASDSSYDPKFIHYEGDVAIYKDPNSDYEYIWNKDTQEWTLRNNNEAYGFEDDTHTYTDKDGVKYFWDKEKSAWFPKIDEEFMAMYQLNYGFVDNSQSEMVNEPKNDPKQPTDDSINKDQKRKAQKAPEWFEVDDQHNTNVYVSNLPLDITEQEFIDLMQKCGLIMRDPTTGKMKVKLYTEKDVNILKGDGLCTYIKVESVELALNLLDGYNYRNNKIKVERAKFQMKGNYDPSLKPKRKKKEKEKLKKMQEKLFDWRPDKLRGQRAKHERIVIIKNAFEPSMFDNDVGLILEIQKDLREESSKCGVVRKVVIFDRHPEGVAQINMKDAEEADEVVRLLNGRWYNQKQLSAEIWDGKTKYKIMETDSEISQRLEKWDKFLETGESSTREVKEVKEENIS